MAGSNLTSHHSLKHGESRVGRRSPEYEAWIGMIARCHNPRCKAFPNYGGRGIIVCNRWRNSVGAFLADMGRKPTPKHELERKNNDKGYYPGNCRWATRIEQSRNKRTNRFLAFRGETRCVTEWAEQLGLPSYLILTRLKYGWSVERTLSTPWISKPRR